MQRHYNITEWLDYLHGFGTPDRVPAFETHLRECTACHATVAWLTKVRAAAAQDRTIEVPSYVLHKARAIFALRGFDQVQDHRGLLARLAFDSFAQPLLQGVRSQQQLDVRHLLYETDGFAVDLRLECERDTPLISLVGQIHDPADKEQSAAHLPVSLMSAGSEICRTVANEFGEFALTYEPQGSLCLRIGSHHRPQG